MNSPVYRYVTTLSQEDCEHRIRDAREFRLLFLRDKTPIGFSVISKNDFSFMGSFAPALVGKYEESTGNTIVVVTVKYSRLLRLPGLVFVAIGLPGLLIILLGLLGGSVRGIPALAWALGLGILPFGVLWWTSGNWLSEQEGHARALRQLERLLELSPADTAPNTDSTLFTR